jgi:hypothetical protein
VEPNESEQGSKAGKAISASELGPEFTVTNWEENQELRRRTRSLRVFFVTRTRSRRRSSTRAIARARRA